MKLKINSMDYELFFKKNLVVDDEVCWGHTSKSQHIITINMNQCEEQLWVTLYHEIGHLVWDEVHPFAMKNDHDGCELWCDRFGVLMYTFHKQNREVLRKIGERFRKNTM